MTQLLSILEGLLFVIGDEGLTIEQIKKTLELKEEEVSELIEQLRHRYEAQDRGLQVVLFAGVCKLVTKEHVHPYISRLLSYQKTRSLSQSALETLAIIAYKQPITRVEIEEIRGVSCDVMLRKLQALDLIKDAGRSEAIGRPILYEVTQDFLDTFELMSLNELPQLDVQEHLSSDQLFE